MRLKKVNAPTFHFKNKTRLDVLNYINEKHPMNIKNMDDLIQRVHDRYPYVEFNEIKEIFTLVIYTLRDTLILGESISIPNLWTRFFLRFKLNSRRNGVKLRVGVNSAGNSKFYDYNTDKSER